MENVKISENGYRMECEFKNVPIAFVNALRRILLSEIPAVVVSNIQILENTTQMTHEMLRHRVEMLPVNVRPEEVGVIRDTRIELRYMPDSNRREVTSDDFVVAGPRKDVLLHDRDLDTPMLFMYIDPNETLHIRANLGIETHGNSHVCVATFKNHIDPERAKLDRDTWIMENNDPRIFDQFYIQRSYARDEKGRPYWFDFAVESIGVLPAKELMRKATEVLQSKIEDWGKVPVLREEPGWYRMEAEGETFTIGQLVQEIMYASGKVEFVSRDVGHPLVPKLVVRFQSAFQPEEVMETFKTQALAMCESVLKTL